MRTASRVFLGLGLFGLAAMAFYASASRFDRVNLQNMVILGLFFVACVFLALLLGRQGALELDGLTLPGHGDDHDEEIHLPGPSWYPAAYGVAALVLMLGLVFDRGILIAGGVLVVLTTIGWGIESVRDYRREVEHHKPAPDISPAAIELAQEVLAFRRAHGGADAVVQHVGRGRAQVVLVGSDGGYGMLHARDFATAREAAALAGTTLQESWPTGLGARLRTSENDWRRMGGETLFGAEGTHSAPRDGTTQAAAKVFLGLAVFALAADVFYATASKFRWENAQGIAILTAFGLSSYYLYLGLRNAKARPEDAAFAGDDHVTIEPHIPDPPVDLETLHLPGPSWWPAFFSVALGVLVLGLVFWPGVLLVGIALLVVCCVGWGIESVHEYRQSISGHHGAH